MTQDVDVVWLDRDAARAMFDRLARDLLGISGADFVKRYEAGEYEHLRDAHTGHFWGDAKLDKLEGMLPFAR